jgi:hypothetical protein
MQMSREIIKKKFIKKKKTCCFPSRAVLSFNHEEESNQTESSKGPTHPLRQQSWATRQDLRQGEQGYLYPLEHFQKIIVDKIRTNRYIHIMKNTIENLQVGSIYQANGATLQYEGNGSLRNMNASVGDSRLVTRGIVNQSLLDALTPSTMTAEQFNNARRQSMLAVSSFYKDNGINA